MTSTSSTSPDPADPADPAGPTGRAAITALLDRARAWMADDPDARDRADLAALLSEVEGGDAAALAELRAAFSGPIAFGTAGLRGRMGPGESRMNLAVVSRAARGLADHLLATLGPSTPRDGAPAEPPFVVIGFDARHRSRAFAERSAAIMTAAGLRVRLADRPCPTPLVAYATRALGADAGVMVTASHNPAADNGYKVYLGGRLSDADGRGVQIVPPADAQIAAAIAAVGPVREIPVARRGWDLLGEDVREAYLERICALPDPELLAASPVRIVHTALHGVGHETAMAAFARVGLGDVHPVAKQADPDPDFPTVPFPNPEEPGAIDLALELARTVEADVVLANDPDADRCAAAAWDPHQQAWRMLSGDELGVLLGAHLVAEHGYDGVLASSIVSSRWLGRIAQQAGLRSASTLTGFKWIARTPGIAFGYEEAIGYCVLPDVVRDKDGLSTALVVAEMAALAKARGTTLVGMLDDLARRDGLHLTAQLSLRVQDLAERDVMLARLREQPPSELAGSPVTGVQDLARGDVATTGLPPTEGMLLPAADDSRVIVRPSGTEPKLKCYLEVREEVGPATGDPARDLAAMTAVRERAQEHLEALTGQMRAVLTGA